MNENAVAWREARRLLCVRLDSMGDVLMTVPAIRALKEASAFCEITLLTSAAGAVVGRLIPEVHRTAIYEAPWMKTKGDCATRTIDLGMIDELRAGAFDAAVIFTVFTQSALPAALMCYLAEIPLRLAHSRENPYRLLTDWVPDRDSGHMVRHEVQRQLDLVSAIRARPRHDRIEIRIPDAAGRAIARLLSAQGIDEESKWLVIAPGATASSRRYRAFCRGSIGF